MNKTVLAIALFALGGTGYAQAQTLNYSVETEKVCKAAMEEYELADEIRCIDAQLVYLKAKLQQTFAKALENTKNKQKLEKEQKKFNQQLGESIKEYESSKDTEEAFEINRLGLEAKEDLALRDWELLDAMLPKSKYSKAINSCVAKAGIATEMAVCWDMKLKVEEKAMNASYKKALAKVPDKSTLEAEQKQWRVVRDQICYFGDVAGNTTPAVELECKVVWTRARSSELAALAKAN